MRDPEAIVLLDIETDTLRLFDAGLVVFLKEPDGTMREVELRMGRGRIKAKEANG